MIRKFIHALAPAAALLIAGNAWAADGDLDLTFGNTHGLALSGIDDLSGDVAMVVQPDGKIVTCSTRGFGSPTDLDFFVARFRSDGSLDPTFGAGGTTTIDFAQARDYCAGVAVQSDGRIVLAGTKLVPTPFGFGEANFAIARLDRNGALDPTFGIGTGETIVSFDAGGSSAAAVTLQPDGRIIVAGRAKTGVPDNQMDFAVVRLLPDGSLDPSFGMNGMATAGASDAASYDIASAVALDHEGRILLSGSLESDGGMARFLDDGHLDTTFGTNGVVDLGWSSANRVIVQADGRIVIAGSVTSGSSPNFVTHMAALRRLDDGTPDPAFGTLGTAIVSFDLSATTVIERASDLVEQSDGKLVLVGSARYGDTNDSKAVATRLDASGGLDPTFGNAGKAIYDPGLSNVDFRSLTSAVPSDGRVIAAGYGIVGDSGSSASDVVVVRLQGDLIFRHGFD